MRNANGKAPFATEVLRKGLPILDRNLKELFDEIQEKAKIACKESIGTDAEEIASVINREVQKWEISNPEEIARLIEDLAYLLKNKVANFPEKEYILGKIDLMVNEKDLTKKFQLLIYIIGSLPGGNQISINHNINAKNVITNSKDSNNSISGDTHISGNVHFLKDDHTSGDTHKSLNFSSMLKLVSEHPIIATVIGGIIVIIIQKKYFQ
jgi:hypothetical protein